MKCNKQINMVVTEPKGSKPLIPNPTSGHDSHPPPFPTSYLPKIHLYKVFPHKMYLCELPVFPIS